MADKKHILCEKCQGEVFIVDEERQLEALRKVAMSTVFRVNKTTEFKAPGIHMKCAGCEHPLPFLIEKMEDTVTITFELTPKIPDC